MSQGSPKTKQASKGQDLNRRGPRVASMLTPRLPQRSRPEYGFKNSREGKYKPSGTPSKALPIQLGKAHTKPMGVRGGVRLQPRAAFLPKTSQGPGYAAHGQPEKRGHDSELKALVEKRVVEPADNTRGSFISPMLVVPKGDGAWRPVINLQCLNQHVTPHQFKMEGIRVVKGLIQKGDWMVKLDLKDAYLPVPIHPHHRKLLRFKWEDQLWQFSSLPFVLSSVPYVFTKLLKPVGAVLRKLGSRCVLYLDDMLIMAQSKERLRSYLATASELLVSLGFIINTYQEEHFHPLPGDRVVLDSRVMTIALPNRKIHQIHKSIRQVLEEREVSTKQLAQLLGSMVAAHPAVLPAPLYYRHLERAKSRAALRGGSSDQGRFVLVARPFDPPQWLQPADHSLGSSCRVRCFDSRLGSHLRRNQHGGAMDLGGKGSPHKLPGVASRLPGPEDFCSGSLVEVVCPTVHSHSHRTLSRKGKCKSRLGVTALKGFKRLENTPGNLPAAGRDTGTILNRSLCLQDQHTTSSLLQLETGPNGTDSGCPFNFVEQSSSVLVSSIHSDQQMSRKDQQGGNRGSNSSTSLAETDLVSKTTGAVS